MPPKIVDQPISGVAISATDTSAAEQKLISGEPNAGKPKANNAHIESMGTMRENLSEAFENRLGQEKVTQKFDYPESMEKSSSFKELRKQVRSLTMLTDCLHSVTSQSTDCDTASAFNKLDEITKQLEKLDQVFCIK